MNTFELYKFVSKKLEAHYCERKARAMVNQYDDASMSELKGSMKNVKFTPNPNAS